MDWQAEIEAEATRILDHFVATPVLETDAFGHPMTLKLEQMQHTVSVKARDAFNMSLAPDVPEAGVVAPTRGRKCELCQGIRSWAMLHKAQPAVSGIVSRT